MADAAEIDRQPLVVAPGEGRGYSMGRMSAVFKADGAETAGRYSISEWWLDPRTQAAGAHSHPDDQAFYVLEGTMSLLVNDEWIEAPAGSFILVPGGAKHDIANRSDAQAGVLDISVPGGFEERMAGIVDWFAQHPLGEGDR